MSYKLEDITIDNRGNSIRTYAYKNDEYIIHSSWRKLCGYSKCNHCGQRQRVETNYCSNCGAKMFD